ncbi:MAG: hypothetical protein GC204_11190 [Chloroflexi bacterium]|nr:hypothetical protein [Chloroflexota bacterium]
MQKQLVLAHEMDVAWIISLWLAIHGGDPYKSVVKIDEKTEQLGMALVEHLAKTMPSEKRDGGIPALQAGLNSLGIQVVQEQMKAQSAKPSSASNGTGSTICTEVPGGHMYCFKVPKVKAPPSSGPNR